MTDTTPNPSDKDMMEFLLWKSLPYSVRLFIGISAILAGLALQYHFYSLLPGIFVVFAGNLFLLPRGVTNKVKSGTYNPSTDWEKIEKHKIDEFEAFHKKIQKWDSTAIDISNLKGGCLFFLLSISVCVVLIFSLETGNAVTAIMTTNIAVLLFPYWFAGKRSIAVVPMTLKKIKLVKHVLSEYESELKDKKDTSPLAIDYYFLLKNKHLPEDFKIKVNIPGQHKDFLGLYAQMSVNQGIYLYFYTVLVAKKGFGLHKIHSTYSTPKKLIAEFKDQSDVEVLVLRQDTQAVASGYITTNKQALYIFKEGLKLAEKAAVKE